MTSSRLNTVLVRGKALEVISEEDLLELACEYGGKVQRICRSAPTYALIQFEVKQEAEEFISQVPNFNLCCDWAFAEAK